MRFRFESEVWRWQARTEEWLFASVPERESDEIEAETGAMPRGFGSVRVAVRVGATEWTTSVFPGDDGYVLPLKRAVRKAEGFGLGDRITVELDLRA